MIRVALTEVVLFALPFVAFLVYRVATRGAGAAAAAALPLPLFALTLAGAVLMVAGLAAFAISGDSRDGAPSRPRYVPAYTEDGRVVPGRFVDE